MDNSEFELSDYEREVLDIAKEAYLLYFKSFKLGQPELTKNQEEILDAVTNILVDKLHIQPSSALIIQYIINFQLSFKEIIEYQIAFYSKLLLSTKQLYNQINLLLDETNFIIKLILDKDKMDNIGNIGDDNDDNN